MGRCRHFASVSVFGFLVGFFKVGSVFGFLKYRISVRFFGFFTLHSVSYKRR